MRCRARTMLLSAIFALSACNPPEQPPAGAAPAAGAARSSTVPDIIVLDTGQGPVTLPHLAHAKELHCATCHSELEPGKVAWDKYTVHSYCHDCHVAKGTGPTTCVECHKG